jgi:hypothetical protein
MAAMVMPPMSLKHSTASVEDACQQHLDSPVRPFPCPQFACLRKPLLAIRLSGFQRPASATALPLPGHLQRGGGVGQCRTFLVRYLDRSEFLSYNVKIVKGVVLMTMTVEIPDELQSLVAAAVARGRFADEQQLVADILRVAVPVLDDYQRLRDDVADSVEMADRGDLRQADFNRVRRQLCEEYNEAGNRK